MWKPPNVIDLREGDDAGLLAEVQLARAEEVEDAVEVARLAVEAVLVEVGVVSVAQVHHLLPRAARAQLAEARLGQPLQEAPRGLNKAKDDVIIDE